MRRREAGSTFTGHALTQDDAFSSRHPAQLSLIYPLWIASRFWACSGTLRAYADKHGVAATKRCAISRIALTCAVARKDPARAPTRLSPKDHACLYRALQLQDCPGFSLSLILSPVVQQARARLSLEREHLPQLRALHKKVAKGVRFWQPAEELFRDPQSCQSPSRGKRRLWFWHVSCFRPCRPTPYGPFWVRCWARALSNAADRSPRTCAGVRQRLFYWRSAREGKAAAAEARAAGLSAAWWRRRDGFLKGP